MHPRRVTMRQLLFWSRLDPISARRRPPHVSLACEDLEERIAPAHLAFGHHGFSHLRSTAVHARNLNTSSSGSAAASSSTASSFASATTATGTTSSTTTTDTASAMRTALQALNVQIQSIQLASGTTVGQLTAIRMSFNTLEQDGLRPTSRSALASFENSLVTTYASGTAVIDNASLLSQFQELFTSSPTTQETTDLAGAYNALAQAVTSANISSESLSKIDSAWTDLLAAQGSTSTATFPYFSLVAGHSGRGGFGGVGFGSGFAPGAGGALCD
jgi:hypothetical protein